jgi:hypothetical protein
MSRASPDCAADGYRGDDPRALRDGSDWGAQISVSHGPPRGKPTPDWEAREALDPRFVLLYSDNYVPFS